MPEVKANPDTPTEDYEIEHVYGYRTFDSRANLHYNADGHAVYMVAALGVVHNTVENTQKIFGGLETKMVLKANSEE